MTESDSTTAAPAIGQHTDYGSADPIWAAPGDPEAAVSAVVPDAPWRSLTLRGVTWRYPDDARGGLQRVGVGRLAEGEVLLHAGLEHLGLLRNQCGQRAQFGPVLRRAVTPKFVLLWMIETSKRTQQRALATAARADKRDARSALQQEVDAMRTSSRGPASTTRPASTRRWCQAGGAGLADAFRWPAAAACAGPRCTGGAGKLAAAARRTDQRARPAGRRPRVRSHVCGVSVSVHRRLGALGRRTH